MAKTKQNLESLRSKDAKTLRTDLSKVNTELQKARVDLAFGRLKKTSTINELRKQIARLQTFLSEQESHNA